MPRTISSLESGGVICIRRASGASFCQVESSSPMERSRPWRTSGSHPCMGASPSLRASAIMAIVVAYG